MQLTYEQIIALVQKNLSSELLKGRWKQQEHPLEGHCYIATESLFHLIDKENYYKFFAVYKDEGGRATHWWLVNKITNEILDPTKEQYTYFGLTPPYKIGRKGTFLTKEPSKRSKVVIDRVLNEIGASKIIVIPRQNENKNILTLY